MTDTHSMTPPTAPVAPAAPPVITGPTLADVANAAQALLVVIDGLQAHGGVTPYVISARASIVAAQGQAEAHILAIEASAAAATARSA